MVEINKRLPLLSAGLALTLFLLGFFLPFTSLFSLC